MSAPVEMAADVCVCGNEYGVRDGLCLACRVGLSGDTGFWASVHAENAVDDRDHRADRVAEEQEERDQLDEERANRWGREATEADINGVPYV